MNYYKTTCKQINYVLQSRQLKKNYVNRFTQVKPPKVATFGGFFFWNFIRGEHGSPLQLNR